MTLILGQCVDMGYRTDVKKPLEWGLRATVVGLYEVFGDFNGLT